MAPYRTIAVLLAALTIGSAVEARSAAGIGLYVNPKSSTAEAAATLDAQAKADAMMLARIPTAAWFTGGSPTEVEARVRDLVGRAARARRIPVLVAYNVPLRDCTFYSSGGAQDGAAYLAWIRGFAAGIGDRRAIVIVEPDGLGVIPWHKDMQGEWEHCRPGHVDAATAAASRYVQLGGAVDILSALPRAKIYLDGTTSSWLAPGEAASRLIKANIARADGFFLNVSNYESDDRVTAYARWVSDCLTLVSKAGLPPQDCPSQYHPARFEEGGSWGKTSRAYDDLFRKLGMRRNPAEQKRAVIDTSRNGQGSWQPPHGQYKDAEVWCNPPGRGLGRKPTLKTGDAYVDAFLWIKIPGESDGGCHRGTTGPMDPERGVVAPPAGHWFPDQARELIRLARPSFAADDEASSAP